MILLLNGAFGVGKTSVARSLVALLPRTILFDPEIMGIALQRLARLAGRTVDDFQDLPLWRLLTVSGLRATRVLWPNVVVPMAFSNAAYLQEIRAGLIRLEPACITSAWSRRSRSSMNDYDVAARRSRKTHCSIGEPRSVVARTRKTSSQLESTRPTVIPRALRRRSFAH